VPATHPWREITEIWLIRVVFALAAIFAGLNLQSIHDVSGEGQTARQMGYSQNGVGKYHGGGWI
jgi:hypothetical protein